MNNHARSKQNREKLAQKNNSRCNKFFRKQPEKKIPSVDVGVLVTEGINIPQPAEWATVRSRQHKDRKFFRRMSSVLDQIFKKAS